MVVLQKFSRKEGMRMERKDVRKVVGCCSELSQSTTGQGQLTERIKDVAQCIYEKRGCMPGHELEDWLEAERIVKSECQAGYRLSGKRRGQ
ncbi:MAG: DUF2934 domain-containing protein [Nitrospira sp.]|nr:DUF2934 domain-containing protein [Nitrospira sp.]